jgi:hypothetical protein
MNSSNSIQSALVTILSGGTRESLELVALCADAIACDARFNLWVCTVAKRDATEEQMIALVDGYERLTIYCLEAAKAFEAGGQFAAFVDVLSDVSLQLKELPSLQP